MNALLYCIRQGLLVIGLCCAGNGLWAQYDSSYVADYRDRLVVSLFQFARFQQLDITQSLVGDTLGQSIIQYKSSSRLMNGIGVDWDKISFSLSWRTPAEKGLEDRTGRSAARNLALSFNLKRWRIESFYRMYKGFYDQNISTIPDFTVETPYHQNPELLVRTGKIKAMYFRNKKKHFSYAAAYANTQRQLKSASSFVLIIDGYAQEIGSSAGLFGDYIPEQYYEGYRNLHSIKLAGIAVVPAVSVNLVIFKRIFANGTLGVGPQLQYRKLNDVSNGVRRELKMHFTSGDARFSFGYNGANFFIYSWFTGDFDVFKFNDIQVNRQLINSGVTLGYRFKLPENRFTRYIKEHPYYRAV
ncbi:MAG: DUF4421 family protein [Flavobacteriales bacterium]